MFAVASRAIFCMICMYVGLVSIKKFPGSLFFVFRFLGLLGSSHDEKSETVQQFIACPWWVGGGCNLV